MIPEECSSDQLQPLGRQRAVFHAVHILTTAKTFSRVLTLQFPALYNTIHFTIREVVRNVPPLVSIKELNVNSSRTVIG